LRAGAPTSFSQYELSIARSDRGTVLAGAHRHRLAAILVRPLALARRRHSSRLLRRHFSGPIRAAADCYPLIPADEYRGPEPRRYSYEGCDAAYQGEVFKLGPKVIFEASDPTVDEWRRLFRVLYADGGMFAHGVTYLEFLDQRLSPKSENERAAHFKELAECGSGSMPRTQAEMRQLLDGDEATSARPAIQQLDFTL
jgi:hypothetical protein